MGEKSRFYSKSWEEHALRKMVEKAHDPDLRFFASLGADPLQIWLDRRKIAKLKAQAEQPRQKTK